MRRGQRLLLVLLVACLGAFQSPPQAPAAGSVRVPATVDPTGVTDVTAQVQAFLDSVPDGSTAEFAEGANYRIEGTILVANRKSFTIDGNGATFFAQTDGASTTPAAEHLANRWPRRRVHFLVDGGRDVELRDLVVRGPHSGGGMEEPAYVEELEGQHGVEFRAVVGGRLHHCDISYVYGDFVSVAKKATNVSVSDCRMSHNGRQGVSITEASNVVVERNVMSQIRRAAVDVEPASAKWAVSNVVIRNNDIGPMRLLALASKGNGGLVRDITFEANRLIGGPLQVYAGAADGERRGTYRIIGNRSDSTFGSPLAAIRFVRVDGVVVRGNEQRLNPDRSGVAVSTVESCGITVADNLFPGASTVWQTDNFACAAGAAVPPPQVITAGPSGSSPVTSAPTVTARPSGAAAGTATTLPAGSPPVTEFVDTVPPGAADGEVGIAAAGLDPSDVGPRPAPAPADASVPVWSTALAAMLLAAVSIGLTKTARASRSGRGAAARG